MNYIDVAALVAAKHVEGGYIYSVGTNGEDVRANAGIAVNLGAWRVPKADLELHTGLRLGIVSVDGFAMNVWDVPAEGGWRWTGGRQFALVRPYWELGGGPHLLLLTVQGTPPQGDVALGTHTGFGATIGHGRVRGVLGVRGGITLGIDQLSGTGTTVDDTYFWEWNPLAARVDGYAGVSFW